MNHGCRCAACREANRLYYQAYRQRNLAQYRLESRIAAARRRARQLGQFIEDVDPDAVYVMHGGRCGICDELIVGDFHVDHVIPLSKGGMHGYVNVQPAHPLCNLQKAAAL